MKPKKEKPAKVDLRVRVPHFPKAYELIRKFVKFDGKARRLEQIQRFQWELPRGLVEGRVRQENPQASSFANIVARMSTLYRTFV